MLKGTIHKGGDGQRMPNSRAALNRLLDPANDAVTVLPLMRRARYWSRAAHRAGARCPGPQPLYDLAAISMLDGWHFRCRVLNVNEGPAWTKMNGL
jgi:hypothetical protein